MTSSEFSRIRFLVLTSIVLGTLYSFGDAKLKNDIGGSADAGLETDIAGHHFGKRVDACKYLNAGGGGVSNSHCADDGTDAKASQRDDRSGSRGGRRRTEKGQFMPGGSKGNSLSHAGSGNHKRMSHDNGEDTGFLNSPKISGLSKTDSSAQTENLKRSYSFGPAEIQLNKRHSEGNAEAWGPNAQTNAKVGGGGAGAGAKTDGTFNSNQNYDNTDNEEGRFGRDSGAGSHGARQIGVSKPSQHRTKSRTHTKSDDASGDLSSASRAAAFGPSNGKVLSQANANGRPGQSIGDALAESDYGRNAAKSRTSSKSLGRAETTSGADSVAETDYEEMDHDIEKQSSNNVKTAYSMRRRNYEIVNREDDLESESKGRGYGQSEGGNTGSSARAMNY